MEVMMMMRWDFMSSDVGIWWWAGGGGGGEGMEVGGGWVGGGGDYIPIATLSQPE